MKHSHASLQLIVLDELHIRGFWEYALVDSKQLIFLSSDITEVLDPLGLCVRFFSKEKICGTRSTHFSTLTIQSNILEKCLKLFSFESVEHVGESFGHSSESEDQLLGSGTGLESLILFLVTVPYYDIIMSSLR